ncbi:MAG: dihydrolipoamide acetyltransferase family protein [Solirubrobacteraceae bacterium]
MAAIEFRLPDVGEGIATAELVDWRVAVGDHVREGQDLAEVQTDKAIVVIPCPTKGTVVRLGASAGEILDVGGVLAVFEADEPEEAPAPGRSRALAAPAMRRLARELGIDLAGVRGSGPHGRIVRQDLQVPPPPPPPSAPRPGQTVPLRGVRAAIARTLTRAWQEIPHVIDYREVDASQLISLRGVLKQRALDSGDERLARALSPTPLIVRAAARALADHPYVNSSIDLERGEITLHEQINIAVATATPDGLTVPVVHDADGKSIPELALAIAELVADARGRRLHPEQLAGSTFTVNNYGGLGIWLGTPIIRPPEVANLGVGAVRDRVVPVDGVPAVRPVLALAVSGDHRVLDGDTLAAFVTQVVRLLEEPLLLLEEFR